MKNTTFERLKTWGFHCNDSETAVITLQNLLKTVQLALSKKGLEDTELGAIKYTIGMCTELTEILEEQIVEIPDFETSIKKAA